MSLSCLCFCVGASFTYPLRSEGAGVHVCSLGPEHDVHLCSCWSVERLPLGQGTFCRAWINFSTAQPHPSTMLTHEDILEQGWREAGRMMLGAD